MKWILQVIVVLLMVSIVGTCGAQDQMLLPGDVCVWFTNQDGSCVQCSISMCGTWQPCPQAATLLFDSPYGNKVRGGSGPSRVEAYADKRNIPIYNITGSNTWDWMKWASDTGRMSAIGCFGSHFQTLLWYNPDPTDPKPWKVRNNWRGLTATNYEFSESEFKKHHLASGQWIVVLKLPPPPPAGVQYVNWWN